MSKVIGIVNAAFDTKDGTHIEGMSLHLTNPIDPKRGRGEEGEKIFLSSSKLAELNFTPDIGNDVDVMYNRFGKVQTLRLVDDLIID